MSRLNDDLNPWEHAAACCPNCHHNLLLQTRGRGRAIARLKCQDCTFYVDLEILKLANLHDAKSRNLRELATNAHRPSTNHDDPNDFSEAEREHLLAVLLQKEAYVIPPDVTTAHKKSLKKSPKKPKQTHKKA